MTQPYIPNLFLPPLTSFVGDLADNACGCIQQEITKGLNEINNKMNRGLDQLNKLVTGPLNEPINAINQTVLTAQNALANTFESSLKDALHTVTDGVSSVLDSSCFLDPIDKFFDGFVAAGGALIGQLAGVVRGLDLRLPTLNLQFKIALSANICGATDVFSGPLASILASGGLSANGSFPLESAFAGMIFPISGDYEAMFKQTVDSIFNIGNMQGMVDNIVGAVNDRIDQVSGQITQGINAVQNFANNAAATVNKVTDVLSDPSSAIKEITDRLPIPGAVAWAAQFSGIFGFSPPGLGGGGKPQLPKDVNYLTKKIQGERVNSLLALNELHKDQPKFFDIGRDEELGRILKEVMGETDSSLSNEEFAALVKQQAGQMSVEGAGTSVPLPTYDSVGHIILYDALGRPTTGLSGEATVAQMAEANAILSEQNPKFGAALVAETAALKEVEGIKSEIELNQKISATTLSPGSREFANQNISRLTGELQETQRIADESSVIRRQEQDKVQQFGPPSSGNPLSQVVAPAPPEEQRFSSLVPVPGTGDRADKSSTVEKSTDFDNIVPGSVEHIALIDEGLSKVNEALQSTEADLSEARIIRASPKSTATDKAQADTLIADLEGLKRDFKGQELELFTQKQRALRDQASPRTNDARLSEVVASPTQDSLLAARASSQESVLRNTASSAPMATTSPVDQGQRFLSQTSFPQTPQGTTQELLTSPGTQKAQQARERIPNSNEVLAGRVTTAVETAHNTPPKWLGSFLNLFNNQ